MRIRTIQTPFPPRTLSSRILFKFSFSSLFIPSTSGLTPAVFFAMNSKIDAAMTKGVSKALRIFLLLLVVVYFALSIAYVVISHTFVAGIGIIPITVSGVLSLSELGILDRVLPKTHHEYNIVLGDDMGQRSGYKLRAPWRLCLDITLVISFLLIVIFMIVEMTVLPYYYFSVAAAFLGSYCSMPLLLGMLVSRPSFLCQRY
jgi:hypothetical protein